MNLNGYLDFASLAEPVPLKAIIPSSISLREDLGDLAELVSSIRSIGLIHPILIRPVQENKFEVIAGSRRYEACKILHWTQIPAVIRDMTPREAYETALAENLQRKSMDPLEEARAFKVYAEREGWGGITRLAESLGKSKSYISQRLLLLSLPPAVQKRLRSGEISPSIARQFAGLDDPSSQEEIAHTVVALKLTTRTTMQLLKSSSIMQCDDRSYPDFACRKDHQDEDDNSIRTLQQAILAMRLAMARLDILKEKCENRDCETAEYLQNLRLEIHQMIDECIKRKIGITRQVALSSTNL